MDRAELSDVPHSNCSDYRTRSFHWNSTLQKVWGLKVFTNLTQTHLTAVPALHKRGPLCSKQPVAGAWAPYTASPWQPGHADNVHGQPQAPQSSLPRLLFHSKDRQISTVLCFEGLLLSVLFSLSHFISIQKYFELYPQPRSAIRNPYKLSAELFRNNFLKQSKPLFQWGWRALLQIYFKVTLTEWTSYFR